VVKDLACKSTQQGVSAQQNSAGAQQHNNQPGATIESKNSSPENKNGAANQVHYYHWPLSLLCGEMKLTDLLLAFFTYTLAVIGWFGLRSTEQIAETLERAYVFHGYTPFQFRGDQATFTLRMSNSGRMPAGIKKVSGKFLARSNLPTRRDGADWVWEIIPYDYIVKPGGNADIRGFLSLRGNHIFVTSIEYEDLFTRRIHTCWMAIHISPSNPIGEQISRAGGDTWNEWD
jgi:hypothetical protein